MSTNSRPWYGPTRPLGANDREVAVSDFARTQPKLTVPWPQKLGFETVMPRSVVQMSEDTGSYLDRLMELHGSECGFCSYCECTRALKFVRYPKDANKKEFRLSDEFENSILLCANCRIEYGY